MQNERSFRWKFVAVGVLVAGLGWPASGAQTPSGQARAAQLTITSPDGMSTTALADTGTLSGSDAREASQGTGAVGSMLSGETLHATSIGGSDSVASEASIANLAVNVAGVTIGAGFVMSRASADGGAGSGSVTIDGLSVNGMPIDVTGNSNQRIDLPGAFVVINERQRSPGGIVVNAIHVVVDGVADIVIASASAAVH